MDAASAFAKIPRSSLRQFKQSPHTLWVLLLTYRNRKSGVVWVSADRIQADLAIDRRQLRRHWSKLIKLGWVTQLEDGKWVVHDQPVQPDPEVTFPQPAKDVGSGNPRRWAKVPRESCRHWSASPFGVWVALLTFANASSISRYGDSEVWPSNKQLIHLTGSPRRRVQTSISQLHEAGLVAHETGPRSRRIWVRWNAGRGAIQGLRLTA